MGFWDGLRRFFCGWERYDDITDWVYNCKTVNDAFDYAKQHWEYERDTKPSDEWQLPIMAFKALQSKNTGSDCDDFAVCFDYFCKAKGIKSFLLAVWNKTEGHAVCVYKSGGKYRILDNFFRPSWGFASIESVCREIYPDAVRANYVRFDSKLNRYRYCEKII